MIADCDFLIAPSEDLMDSRISLVITDSPSTGNQVDVALRMTASTVGSSGITEAVVVFNGTMANQTVSSAACNIASIKVYRGRRQVIEISHKGFSLNERGNIEVSEREKELYLSQNDIIFR